MQIDVSGHHINLTPPMKQYVVSKLDKLERHFDKITAIHVICSVEKQRQKAEATIRTSQGDIHADAESDDLYTAIDLLTDKLDRQLLKKKEKKVDRKQRSQFR